MKLRAIFFVAALLYFISLAYFNVIIFFNNAKRKKEANILNDNFFVVVLEIYKRSFIIICRYLLLLYEFITLMLSFCIQIYQCVDCNSTTNYKITQISVLENAYNLKDTLNKSCQ